MNMLKITFQSAHECSCEHGADAHNCLSEHGVFFFYLKNGNEMCSVTGAECTVSLGIHSFVSWFRRILGLVYHWSWKDWSDFWMVWDRAISRVIWSLCWCGRAPVAFFLPQYLEKTVCCQNYCLVWIWRQEDCFCSQLNVFSTGFWDSTCEQIRSSEEWHKDWMLQLALICLCSKAVLVSSGLCFTMFQVLFNLL